MHFSVSERVVSFLVLFIGLISCKSTVNTYGKFFIMGHFSHIYMKERAAGFLMVLHFQRNQISLSFALFRSCIVKYLLVGTARIKHFLWSITM